MQLGRRQFINVDDSILVLLMIMVKEGKGVECLKIFFN